MKRCFRIACVMALLVALCSLPIAVSAAADPDALQITSLTVSRESEDIVLEMTFLNDKTGTIDEFGLALMFIGADNNPVYAYADTLEGFAQEATYWYYLPEEYILPAGQYRTRDVFSGYSAAVDIAVAIRYYHILDGDYVLFPESEWHWVRQDTVGTAGEANRDWYTSPPDSLYDSIGDYYIGYSYYILDDYNAAYYDKNQGGEWITAVEAESPADAAGLLEGDLILFVDGVKPTEDFFAVDYASAAIQAGEKVEWVYERDGVIYTTYINAP